MLKSKRSLESEKTLIFFGHTHERRKLCAGIENESEIFLVLRQEVDFNERTADAHASGHVHVTKSHEDFSAQTPRSAANIRYRISRKKAR